MSEMLTKSCPNCGTKLTFDQNDSTVTCYSCDCVIEVAELSGNSATGAAAFGQMAAMPAILGFDNPESGIVFLENFFETYDWETYKQTSAIAIPEIVEVIANNKMKNGAVPEAWYMDFQGLFVPVFKKFEALNELAAKIAENYDPVDTSAVFENFDLYRRIAKVLKNDEEKILKVLEVAVKFAERFNLNAARLADMKAALAQLRTLFDKIPLAKKVEKDAKKPKVLESVEELPEYQAARTAYSKKLIAEYNQRGIDAESVYREAVEKYKNSENKSEALKLFEIIREYADAKVYIDKINQYVNFDNRLYRFFGRYFIYKVELYKDAALNPKSGCLKKKKKGAEAADDSAVPSLAISLYAVVNGIPEREPLVKGIEKVITCYGSKFYYFKKNAGIACYDIYAKQETIVDPGKDADYCKDDNGDYIIGFASHAPYFFVQRVKKLSLATGCGSKKKNEKAAAEIPLNPYCIMSVDMSVNQSKIIVPELVEIAVRSGDKIFYNFATIQKFGGGCFRKAEEKPKTVLMVCDVSRGTSTQVLNDDCEIQTVYKEKIVYTKWTPNSLNQDLYSFDLESGVNSLIENNIYSYFDVIDGMIYYTVGNKEFLPLVRNNFEGTEREQIMNNVEKIIGTRAGWLYVKKGKGYNSVLQKISADGKKRVTLCSEFKYYLRFTENNVYYVDVRNNLRVVRTDGLENKVLARDVDHAFVAEEGIYYVREELVDDMFRKSALSLYMMDNDGLNIRKIVFSVDVVQDIDKTELYYSKNERVRYKVYKPGKEKKFTHQIYDITKYYRMDKATGVSELVLTQGLPEATKKGCFGLGKPKPVDMVYEEDPIVHSYRTRGLTDLEIVEKEEDEAIPEKTPLKLPLPGCINPSAKGASAPKKKAASKGCGCGKGCANFSKRAK